MTEITRVPLQPIASGSVTKLWVGVAAALLAAGGIAWATKPPVVEVETVAAGQGASPTTEDVVLVNYVGKLDNGQTFDAGQSSPFPVAGVVPGFSEALQKMKKGGKYKVHIPWQLGYGQRANGPIPARSNLNFDVELLDFRNMQQVQQEMAMMRQMQALQAGHGSAPQGVPVPGAPAQ